MNTESSLIKTARFMRRSIVLFIVVSIVAFSWNPIVNFIKKSSEQEPIETPSYFDAANFLFGELTYPPLENIYNIDYSKTTFTLRKEGTFPTFPDSIYVYAVEQPKEDFLTVTTAQEVSQKLGYKEKYKAGKNSIIFWGDPNSKYLEFNRKYLSWILTTNPTFKNTFKPEEATQDATIDSSIDKFVKNIQSVQLSDSFLYDYSQAKTYPVTYSKNASGFQIITDKKIQSTTYLVTIPQHVKGGATDESDSDVSKYINDKGIKIEFPIVTKNPYLDRFHAFYDIKYVKPEQFLGIRYSPTKLAYTKKDDLSKNGIYNPIKPDAAYSALTRGKGFLMSVLADNSDFLNDLGQSNVATSFEVNSSATELAYYQEELWASETKFLYPIYIFHATTNVNGKVFNCIFYVPAISSE